MKTYADIFGSTSDIISEEDQILYIILAGLTVEYDSVTVIVLITSGVVPYRLQDVTPLLLAYENRLEQYHVST